MISTVILLSADPGNKTLTMVATTEEKLTLFWFFVRINTATNSGEKNVKRAFSSVVSNWILTLQGHLRTVRLLS